MISRLEGLGVKRARLLIAVWGLGVAALAAAGCGSTAASVSTPATTAPTATTTSPSTASPSATAKSGPVAGVTGGAGDTSANPDQNSVCAASGSSGGSIIAYLTVAGSDATNANSICSTLEGSSDWVAISTVPAGQYESVPECHVTYEGGEITARIYTAKGGSPAETEILCDTLLSSSTLPTLAP
jgi:hypothetical protein